MLLEERLSGATLIVFANKQDLPGALTEKEIREVTVFNILNLDIKFMPALIVF